MDTLHSLPAAPAPRVPRHTPCRLAPFLLPVALALPGALPAAAPASEPSGAGELPPESGPGAGADTPAPAETTEDPPEGSGAEEPSEAREAAGMDEPSGRRDTPDTQTAPSPLDRALSDLETEDDTPAASRDEDASPLDRALRETPPPGRPGELFSVPAGAARLRLLDISADLLVAAGGSSERGEALARLQGGGHDPRKRGFTLQALELSLLGAVDPYFTGEAHLLYFLDPQEGESRFELEEAFLTTLALPWGLERYGFQIEAGHFFTEFGRINPRHPHAWDWLDQPVILTRLFGPDGMRAPGARLGWLLPLPWFAELHLGIQNANGETQQSFLASDELFEERPVGGRPFVDRDVRGPEDLVWLARLDQGLDLSDEVSGKLGGSLLLGPNATGPDGATLIWGVDAVLKWRPLAADRGWPFVVWQTEFAERTYTADNFFDPGAPGDPADDVALAGDRLHDRGLYTQVLWGFVRDWAAGVRVGFAWGDEASVLAFSGRDEDPFRDDRLRVSPLLVWHPTEFSRLRLQYNHDRADHVPDEGVHSVWIGAEILWGEHPAHEY